MLGFILVHHLLDPNTDSETKLKKVNQSPHTQAKPRALSVVLTETTLELLSELLQRENVHRKHKCQHKTRVITGRLIGFPEKEENKTPSSWTLPLDSSP